ncbi:hypothetical protein [Deinococcus altitudinis]|uniref:hypothetical protein n=1 Tax=Deinococcus altitudinis TaxID=468914 RepID=UPI003891F28D
MTEALEARFEQALLADAEQARSIGYNPHQFRRMVLEQGGVELAQKLLRTSGASYGFEVLREKGRLDLSMEALVVQTPWKTLFTDEELMTAMERLRAGGYFPQLD